MLLLFINADFLKSIFPFKISELITLPVLLVFYFTFLCFVNVTIPVFWDIYVLPAPV